MRDLVADIEDVYRRRYVAFRNGVLPLTGTLDAAHDAVQEGFARALRDRRQFRGTGSLEGWIWRITFHAALEARRRQGAETLDDAVAESAVLEDERDPEVVAALRALPPRQRLIVFLRYFADLSYDDIADACGISEGTVAAALAQARAHLADALKEGAQR